VDTLGKTAGATDRLQERRIRGASSVHREGGHQIRAPQNQQGRGGSHGGREGRPCPDQWEEGGGRGALTAARKQPAQPRDDHTEGTEVRRVTAAVARKPRTPATMTATATLRGAARVAVPSPAWGKEAPRRARERTQGSALPASRGTGSRRERSGSSRGGEM